jgi:hypothetical protein
MAKDWTAHFRSLLESKLPADARILSPDGEGDLILLATWRLNSDPARPNKRSRMIRIVISTEAIEDYRRGSDGTRLAGDGRFLGWVGEQLAAFDPNHDAPLGVEPQVSVWFLDTLTLNR